jgi:chaperonin GroES
MATAPDLTLEQDEPPIAAEGLMLEDILSGRNLAEMLDDEQLGTIGQRVVTDYELDLGSRGRNEQGEGWEARYERNMKVAMQIKEDKVFPWAGASNSKSPILTIAAIQFNAEAYPVIVDGSNLVKGRVLGPDPDGAKRARADRIGQHMTWQLLYRMPGWEAETDRLLLILPIVGCMFRKTYYDSIENANCSEIVNGLDFVIDNDAKSIESAPRYTQVLHLYPYEVQGLVNAGLWLDVPRDDEDSPQDDEALGDYYEQHRCLDLDEDGFPEHYVVTCTKEGKVARIVPCFGPESITIRRLDTGATTRLKDLVEEAGQAFPDPMDAMHAAMQVAGPVVKIERRQYFTKYGFIPSPDGSFYDIGFGDLLDNVTGLIDRLHNQILDAATLANAQGGFIGSGVNVRGGNFAFRTVGEWKRVDAGGQDLRSQIVPLALPGPSPVSLSLLEMLYQQARDITSAQDVVAGRAPANQPATTTLALIEQAGQVRKGIFKRIWRAFGAELRILRRLNRDYLDEEEYFNLNDPQPEMGEDGQPAMDQDGNPAMTTTAKVGREDYQDDDLDVVPVADPSQVSDTHRMARAQAAFEMFANNPLVNQEWLIKRMLEALGATDTKEAMKVPQPPPPPEVMKIVGQLAIDKDKAASDAKRADADAAQKNMAAAVDATTIGLLEDAAILAAKAIGEPDAAEQSGGIPGMGGEPPDAGLLGPPPQEANSPDGALGPGMGADPGGAGAGGPIGPAMETPLQ